MIVARAGQNSRRRRRAWAVALSALVLVVAGRAVGAKIEASQVQVDTPVYEIPGGARVHPETWVYDFTWGVVPVGSVEVAVGPEPEAADGELGVAAKGRTNSVIDLLWRYRLNARGTILTDPFRPGHYKAVELERSKRKETEIAFDAERQVRATRRKGDKLKEIAFDGRNTYDIISAVFAALSFDYEPGAAWEFDTLTGSSRYLVKVVADRRETIQAAEQSFDAWRLEVTAKGLTDPDDDGKHRTTHLWVSAERPRRLLAARSELYIGSVEVRLAGLRNGADALHDSPSLKAAPPSAAEQTRPSDEAARAAGAAAEAG